MNLKRILLAEDDPHGVELTLAALEEFNLANDVAVVEDGEEALDYLFRRGKYQGREEGNPAVLLLDLKMPKVDGIEVLRQIRQDAGMSRMPVVILTSSREESDKLRSYEGGVNAYVVKPVDFLEFVKAVKHLGIFWAILNEPPAGCIKRVGERSL